jgi:hypothetical protein
MQFKHAPAAVSAVFDEPNLVSAAGLVPVMRLAAAAGLADLSQECPVGRGRERGGEGVLAGRGDARGG